MNEAAEKAVELAGYAATASNKRLERAVAKLIRTDPRLVEAVKRELSVARPKFPTAAEERAYEKRMTYLHSVLSSFLLDAATMGVVEAPVLAAATGEALGDSGEMAVALGAVVAATTTGNNGGSVAETVVMQRAMERTTAGLDTQLIAAQTKKGIAVQEYTAAVERKQEIREIVQDNPQAVNEQGEKLSLKLRGPDKSVPVIEATDEDAFAFLMDRGTDAATTGRQEAEAAAMEVIDSELMEAEMSTTEGDGVPQFVLVTDSGGCKICKTIAGDGFMTSGTIFIHDGCGCTLRITRRGKDDPVYQYNVKNHGGQSEAAKQKAMKRWNLTEEEVNSPNYYALVLGEANKIR